MSQRSVRYAWYVAGLLTLVQIVSYLDRFLPSLLVPPIKHDLGINDFQIGLLLGPAFIFFYITLGIPLGWLADRVNRRWLLSAGVAVWCSLTAAGALAGSFVPLFMTRLGVGIGEAAVAPASISLISDYFPRDRRSAAISLFMAGAFLGAGIAFLFFGPLVHAIEGLPPITLPLFGPLRSWRLCFLIIGAPGILLTLLLLTIAEPRRADRVALTEGGTLGATGFAAGLTYIGRRWRAFGTLFLASACNLTMGALALWNVALFERTWGWNVAQVGFAVGLILLTAGPIGTVAGAYLTNRDLRAGRCDGTLRALFLGLLIGVPAYTVFPLMPSASLGLVALFVALIGQSISTCAGPATLVTLAPGQIRAQATAVYYLVISVIAQLIGPPLVGLIADELGGPKSLRYAISIVAAAVGVPSIWLVALGFGAYRRQVTQLDQEIDALAVRTLSVSPAPTIVGAK